MITQENIKGRHLVATCRACHREVRHEGHACPYCGFWKSPPQSSPATNESPRNTSRTAWGTMMYLLAFLLVGPILVWGYHDRNGRRVEVPVVRVSVMPPLPMPLPLPLPPAAMPTPPKATHVPLPAEPVPLPIVFSMSPVQQPLPPPAEPIVAEVPTVPAQEERQALKRHEVPFVAYEGSAKRIIVSATFNDSVTVPMLIDTGAPGLVISPQLAEKLGVFSQDAERVLTLTSGIGGSTLAILTIIDKIQVGGASDHFIPTTVTRRISPSFEGLIGMDFTSKYSMKVDPAKKVVVFEELPPDSNSPGGRDEHWWRSTFQKFNDHRNAWQQYGETVDRQMQRGIDTATLKKLKTFSEWQYEETNKLHGRLERHASENSVPRHWR